MTIPMLALTALLVGCGGEEPPPPATPEAKPETAPPAPAAKIDLSELKKQAEQVTLVPAPKEMQKALDKANIKEALESLVQERKIAFDAKDADVAAVKTGLVLADTLLTVRTAPPEKLAERMKAVKAGDDIDKTIDSLIGDIQNLGGGARDNLEQELEQMHAAVIPEIEYEAGDQIVPLIQAGAWLEGSNLLAVLNAYGM